MRLEDVDRFDGVFDLATRVDGLNSEHGLHCHVGKEVVVAAKV
jgi:hypothetical protein